MGRPFLHPDLIFEILSRLPAKPLFRFSCVCRSWCDLVSLPVFSDRRPPALLSCATVEDDKGNVTLHISTIDSEGIPMKQFVVPAPVCDVHLRRSPPFVVSTCGDLLLLTDNWNTFLCNYSTQELVTLPDIGHNCSFNGVGFGHVPSTMEFKVLADVSYFGYGCKVLTVGDNQWRDAEPPPFSYLSRRSAFLNGNIHFLSAHGSTGKIVSFNLEREEWVVLAGPSNFKFVYHALKELSGYLCLLNCRLDTFDSMNIWLLKDYENSSWVKQYTIRISTFKAKRSLSCFPLAIEDGGKLLVQVDTYNLQIYDPETKRSREIHHFEELDDTKHFFAKSFSSLGRRGIDIAPTNNCIPPIVKSSSSTTKQGTWYPNGSSFFSSVMPNLPIREAISIIMLLVLFSLGPSLLLPK